jgi:hypothetical protein
MRNVLVKLTVLAIMAATIALPALASQVYLFPPCTNCGAG